MTNRDLLIVPFLALMAAKGPLIDNEGYAKLTIHVLGSGSGDKGQHLNVESWSWGTGSQSNAGTAGRITGIATDPADPAARGHSMLGASDKVTVGGARTESLQTAPAGAGPGTLTVRGRFANCTVGQRYGGMQFSAGGLSYELTDVVVRSCPAGASAGGEATFAYGKVRVKGWNPEKKED